MWVAYNDILFNDNRVRHISVCRSVISINEVKLHEGLEEIKVEFHNAQRCKIDVASGWGKMVVKTSWCSLKFFAWCSI